MNEWMNSKNISAVLLGQGWRLVLETHRAQIRLQTWEFKVWAWGGLTPKGKEKPIPQYCLIKTEGNEFGGWRGIQSL